MNTADLIWLNGEFVAWEDAKVHVLTHSMHYGTGVFEGIRAYETAAGHGDLPPPRPPRPAREVGQLYYMDLPYSREQLREVTHELIVRNGFKSCYIRPLVYRGYGPMGLNPLDNPVEAMVASGSGAPTSARRASATASARACRPAAGSRPTR